MRSTRNLSGCAFWRSAARIVLTNCSRGAGLFAGWLLLITIVGCASHRPLPASPPAPVSFASADGAVVVTVQGSLRCRPKAPTTRRRLEAFLYGPEDDLGGMFRRPQGLAVKGHTLYVADQGMSGVIRYDLQTGSFRQSIGSRNARSCPVSVAVDDDGNLYIADGESRSVVEYDRTGRLSGSLPIDDSDGALFRPSAVVVHGDILYIADAGSRTIRRFDRVTRKQLAPLGSESSEGGMGMPTGLAVAPRGELLVADGLLGVIHRFDTSGKQLDPIGEYGGEEGQLIRPTAVVCTPSGFVVAADAGREALMIFDSGGTFVMEVGGPKGSWNGFLLPSGLTVLQGDVRSTAVEPSGDWIAVSDTMRGDVVIVAIRAVNSGQNKDDSR